MKQELTDELERCKRLFNNVFNTVEGTNAHDDATLDSDSARNGLRDMVFDYIAYARQMALDEMPGDPLRFAASSLKKIRRSWNALRFFDRESYQEGFPSHHDVMNAGNGDVRDGKRPLQQYSWNSVPNQTAHLGITDAPLSKRRTSSPKSQYPTSEYLALPRARRGRRGTT